MNSKLISKTFYFIGIAAVLYGLFLGRDALGLFEKHLIQISTPSTYAETITIVADKEFVPFSFMSEEGEPTGAMIELLYAMAHEMRVNVKIVFANWPQALQMVQNHEADALFGLEYTEEYAEKFELTEPVFVNQLVAFGQKEYNGIHDLLTKKLGIFTYNLASTSFFTPLIHMRNVTAYSDHKRALQDILDGKIDYLIGRYAIGAAMMKRDNMQLIEPHGDVLATSAFCFGLAKNNIEMKERMNNAILTLQEEGITLAIADKWLNTYSTSERLYQFIRQHKNIIVPFLFFFISFICIYFAHYIRNLKEKSYRDVTTGLYNKKETERLVTKSINASSAGMMVVLDIDDFKSINDTFGHAVGDDCILHVASTLRNSFRSTDIIGRVGGDEFMVYAPAITTEDLARKKIAQVLTKFTNVSDAVGETFPLHVSIGFALHKPHELTFAQLYKLADNAMYEAKHTGKNHACFAGDF